MYLGHCKEKGKVTGQKYRRKYKQRNINRTEGARRTRSDWKTERENGQTSHRY